MNSTMNYRSAIIDEIVPYARKNPQVILLVSDMGFGVTDAFAEEFPERIFNMGIMEQGTVGIAAGMAMTGLIPVVYSIVNFIVYRALEQVRNDVVLQNLNVKFIATGVNNYFNFLGRSHCCGNDDVALMNMIGLKVFDPYKDQSNDFKSMVHAWINDDKAGYIRV